MAKRKCFITLSVVLIITLVGIIFADNLRDDRIRAKIDTDFMVSYNELILGMLNRSIQSEEIPMHKYDTSNTKYGQSLIALYPYNSYLNHGRFYDILQLLDQSSGCDAWYDIDMDKELYDSLNTLGKAVFSKSQEVTDKMLDDVYAYLCDSVDFVPGGSYVKGEVLFFERTPDQNSIEKDSDGTYHMPSEFTAVFPFFEDEKPESVVAYFAPNGTEQGTDNRVIAGIKAPYVYMTSSEVIMMDINLPSGSGGGKLWFEYNFADGKTEKSHSYKIYSK